MNLNCSYRNAIENDQYNYIEQIFNIYISKT